LRAPQLLGGLRDRAGLHHLAKDGELGEIHMLCINKTFIL
jgi:hypothetical protein